MFDTVDNALLRNPGSHPLSHSDRGFQYTNMTLHKNCQQINFCWQEKFIFFSIVYLTGSSSFIRYNSPLIPTVCFVLHSPTILPNYIPTCTKYHFLIFISDTYNNLPYLIASVLYTHYQHLILPIHMHSRLAYYYHCCLICLFPCLAALIYPQFPFCLYCR